MVEKVTHEPNVEAVEDESIETEDYCPECSETIIQDEKHGEKRCSSCGLVVDEKAIDPGPEWRAFDDSERNNRKRVGSPVTELQHDKGLSTRISWRNKDSYGNELSAGRRELFRRLRKWNKRFTAKDAQERNLKQAFGEIDRMASALGLPKACRETACVIYREAVEKELLPGRTIESVATASLYAATREHNMPRTITELSTVSRVEELRIERAYRYIARELSLQLLPQDPAQYVPQFSSELSVSHETERLTQELVDAAKSEALHSGVNPASIAAAALYAAIRLTNEEVTQGEVGDAAFVSRVTIRKHYKEILNVWEKRNRD